MTAAGQTAAEAQAGPEETGPGAGPRHLGLYFWLIGIVAVAAAVVFAWTRPAAEAAWAERLLDEVTIVVVEAPGKHRMNPHTKKETEFKEFEAYIGGDKLEGKEKVAARKPFVALMDLCGRKPKLAMRIMRNGLATPITDKQSVNRRLVAAEMAYYLRDVWRNDPNDPELRLKPEDLLHIAELVHGRKEMNGVQRHASDLVANLLAVPLDAFPPGTEKRVIPVQEKIGGKLQGVLPVLVIEAELDGHRFGLVWFYEGRYALALMEKYKDRMEWDPALDRFKLKPPFEL